MFGFEITSARYIQEDGVNTAIQMVTPNMPAGADCIVVPLAPGNSDYDEIMRQVEAGTLTIQDAD